MTKRDRSPTTGRFIKRGLLAKLASMVKKPDEAPMEIEHDPDAKEQGTTRVKKRPF